MSESYFDKVARQWDGMRKAFFSENVREKALSVAGVEPGKVACDVGAGTGFITEGLIQRGVEVIVVDHSAAMLEEMRKKFEKASIQYRRGEAENLPIGDGEVDYVFANMVLHHVENPFTAVKEMRRIVKSGGIVVITDMDEHNFEFLREEQFDRWMGFKREDVFKWFTESGLREVKVECVGESCCSQSESGGEFARVSIFVASGRK